jgi:RecB family exonuclease
LEGIDPEYRFFAAEQRFGLPPGEKEPLCVEVPDQGFFRLRGFIDRVDINRQGAIRIVDYNTSGTAGFDNRAVKEGKKLQLPLYALAAQERLGLGTVKEGFYFHLLAAQPSTFKLSSYREGSSRGPEVAMNRAAEVGWQALSSIKEGDFFPQPPDNGCPDYCPAVDFCWHYRPRRW